MKTLLYILISSISFLTFSQGTAGIYKVKWSIDKRLTNSLIIQTGGFNTTNQINIPQNFYDSVVLELQRITQDELRSDAKYLYILNKKGKELRTGSTVEQVGGFPRGTKKKAMKTEYKEYYVKFKIRVGLNKTFGIGNEVAQYSRLKPYVKVKMKAYGLDRRVHKRKVSRRSDFQSINSFDINMGGTTVTNTKALPIEQVMDMVFKGLEKFKNKVQ